MRTHRKSISRRFLVASLVALATTALADTAQRKFARPDEAIRALVDAAAAGNKEALTAILGPGSEEIVSSGDPVADRNAGQRVVAAAKQRTRLETLPSGTVIAHLAGFVEAGEIAGERGCRRRARARRCGPASPGGCARSGRRSSAAGCGRGPGPPRCQ